MDAIEGDGRERSADTPWTRLRENASGVVSLLVTAVWLGAMFTGQEWWLAALLVGYIVVVPLAAILFDDEIDGDEWADDYTSTDEPESETTTAGDPDTRDALETLRERYAAGELTDDQFERKLERLLDTETLEDAERWARERDRGDRDRDRDLEYER
ncbi:SHOCT domain-containing protein [Natrinema salsiterrestre]|uniref:SHOCT domain-containing protein n=1 Tax=Natrinema salsiterrestre TaxID=2950540 RepID=A0A9Q4L7T7_9EURY|nr:SHOCT domain-containing protein [Natrinema salsiterrestre]MDF9746816.1 SHOCT domain-containing protein [Natrinema salsiterrestre]